MNNEKLDVSKTFRFGLSHVRKLKALTKHEDRTESAVLRRLVDHAYAAMKEREK